MYMHHIMYNQLNLIHSAASAAGTACIVFARIGLSLAASRFNKIIYISMVHYFMKIILFFSKVVHVH